MLKQLWQAYCVRQIRKYLIWTSLRSRHALKSVVNRTSQIRKDSFLVVCVVRNEAERLPYFLDYYRKMGIDHFLIVENDSTDDTQAYLAEQPDVSIWHTKASYKKSRFGIDWATWLLMRYGRGKWCLTVDADELFVFASSQEVPHLSELTQELDAKDQRAFGALMIDLYPKGPIHLQTYSKGQDPLEVLQWFDAAPYRVKRQSPRQNLWVQGGVRERVFFKDDPVKGPTLNKVPLVKWHWRFAYFNSTHSILPPRLNLFYEGPGDSRACGALLHTKFLPSIAQVALEEKERKQHFRNPNNFGDYYDQLSQGPDLWCETSVKFENVNQLVSLGLMSDGQDPSG